MHDKHKEYGHKKDHNHNHDHEHEHSKGDEKTEGIVKLRKMIEYWVGHNEEHARSYRLWATRARDAGCDEPSEILEEIASGVIEQNEKLFKIIRILESRGLPDSGHEEHEVLTKNTKEKRPIKA